MATAPHVAAAIAACGSRPAAQPRRLAAPPAGASHLAAAVAAGSGSRPVQAKPRTPAANLPGVPRSAGRAMPVVQRMQDDDWRESGFIFSGTGGFYHGQASKQDHQWAQDVVPTKTYLYLGAGDLSAPARKAKKHKNHSGYDIVATELQTEENLRQTGGQGFETNLRKLLKRGHTVAFEVDGTNNLKGTYDRIIFQNPHTGKYGSAENYDASADVESITSNKLLLDGIFKAARGRLEPHGLLEITVCGFPYVSSTAGLRSNTPFRQGMGFENPFKANTFAGHYGFQVASHASKGVQWIRRNNGEWFQATLYKIKFREA